MDDLGSPAIRLMVFLTEDDRVGHAATAEVLFERARALGLAGATLWRGIEGFGASGRLRASRLPDLARGLPLVLEVIDKQSSIEAFLSVVRELAAGSLVTTEEVEIAMSRRPEP
jgi:PII-like signaling protein